MTSLIAELRRRNVFRVGMAYLVFSWLVIQIADTIAEPLGLPASTLMIVVWVSVTGFPFALLVGWAFELTPDGLRRSADVPPDEAILRRIRFQWNAVIIALLSAVIVVLLADRFWIQSAATSPGAEPTAPDSIAILPFANLSDDPDNEFFADGLAEELLNLLAQVDGLKVAARTSSFYFKDKNPTISEVAEALDVDTVVEGSVRRSGDTIRVVVQLISADDSAHLWSERYDRPLTDLFAVQDDIANQIVAAMMPHLQGEDRPEFVTDTEAIEPADFERFMLARQRFYDDTRESRAVAKDGFLAVTEAAPEYAAAWAWLARSWIAPGGRGDIDIEEAREAARSAIDEALALDPDQPMAFVAQGNLLFGQDQFDEAIENYDHAITLNGDLVDAYIARQDALVQIGKPEAAIDSLLQARVIDPLHPDVLEGLAHLLNLQGQRADAMDAVESLWLVNSTAAVNLETHLYQDSFDSARSIYVAEEFGNAGADELAILSMVLGLHEDPIIEQTEYWPVSLAVQGRREEALTELETVRNGSSRAHFKADMEYRVQLILGDSATAKEMLWQRWSSQSGDNPGPNLDLPDLVMLAGLMRKHDDTEHLDPVLDSIRDIVGILSESHASSYHFFNGYYDLLAGNVEEGAQHFEILADNGYAGMSFGGTVTMAPWLFEGDSRLESVLERFRENRNAQIDELQRLRADDVSLEQVREEYIAAGR